MTTATISDARTFSLQNVQKNALVSTDDLDVTLLCFEAGPRDDEGSHGRTCIYQVLEGEVLVRQNDESNQLGKGKILTIAPGTAHTLENAGGGLLVVLATCAR